MSTAFQSGGTQFAAPVLALCGFSGSGKTTLLEAAIPHLIARGLSVAAVKHDSHGFVVDKEGKDSDRLFRAGATVALRGPSEQFLRRGLSSALTLQATLSDLARDHDLLLVEGHKDTPLPKLWAGNAETASPPENVTGVQQILPWDSDRLKIFLDFVESWLPNAWCARPLFAGLLVGGKSSRMGTPKQLVSFAGRTLGEIAAHALSEAFAEAPAAGAASVGDRRPIGWAVPVAKPSEAPSAPTFSPNLVILGAGSLPEPLQSLPRLADVPELGGPIAGLLAAHRWMPNVAWILAACDHPWLTAEDIRWLINQRKPGVWAVLPRQPDNHPCPTLALYEPQSLAVLERSLLVRGPAGVRIAELFNHQRSFLAPQFTRGIVNVNTPQELMAEAELVEPARRPAKG